MALDLGWVSPGSFLTPSTLPCQEPSGGPGAGAQVTLPQPSPEPGVLLAPMTPAGPKVPSAKGTVPVLGPISSGQSGGPDGAGTSPAGPSREGPPTSSHPLRRKQDRRLPLCPRAAGPCCLPQPVLPTVVTLPLAEVSCVPILRSYRCSLQSLGGGRTELERCEASRPPAPGSSHPEGTLRCSQEPGPLPAAQEGLGWPGALRGSLDLQE